MRKILFIVFLLSACSVPDKSSTAKEEILKADRDMCVLAAKEGFFTALLQYADSGMVKPSDGSYSIIGKKAFADSVSGKTGPKTIFWEPVQAEAASSGEMGYTRGNWKFEKPDTSLFGCYITVWKKQSDGSWKWTYDGGNSTPAPKK